MAMELASMGRQSMEKLARDSQCQGLMTFAKGPKANA